MDISYFQKWRSNKMKEKKPREWAMLHEKQINHIESGIFLCFILRSISPFLACYNKPTSSILLVFSVNFCLENLLGCNFYDHTITFGQFPKKSIRHLLCSKKVWSKIFLIWKIKFINKWVYNEERDKNKQWKNTR